MLKTSEENNDCQHIYINKQCNPHGEQLKFKNIEHKADMHTNEQLQLNWEWTEEWEVFNHRNDMHTKSEHE